MKDILTLVGSPWIDFLLALIVFGVAPELVLRVLILLYPRSDARRRELLAELHVVPRRERPFWIAEKVSLALCEGLGERLKARRQGRPNAVPEGRTIQAICWVAVFAAFAVDIPTFYQVLVVVLNAPEWLVWAAVVGFVAVVLTLAHNTGLQIRMVVDPRYQIASRAMVWTFGGTWLLLGLVAFGVRFVITQPLSSDASTFSGDRLTSSFFGVVNTTSQHVTALLFLALYIATGVITALAGGYSLRRTITG